MHHFILLPPRSVQLLRRVARVTAAWQQTFLAWAGPLPAQTRRTCKMFANCTFAASSVVTSLWIIVTEWDLELGYHRSNTVHQFFCKPVVDTFWKMPSACDCIAPCWLQLCPHVCGARQWWRWQYIPANIDCSPPGRWQRSCSYWHSQPTLVRSFKTFI